MAIDKYMAGVVSFVGASRKSFPISTLHAVRSFCLFFESIFRTHSETVSAMIDREKAIRFVEFLVLFSMVWAFGSICIPEDRLRFDAMLRTQGPQYPSKGTVYDYILDPKSGSWWTWEQYFTELKRSKENVHSDFVSTVHTIPFEFWSQTLVASNQCLLITGDPGTGKTALLKHIAQQSFTSRNINVSIQTHAASENLLKIMESCLEKKSKNSYMPIGNKHLLVLIDDVTSAPKDGAGAQPSLEFLRYWIENNGWFDRSSAASKIVENMSFVAATNGSKSDGQGSLDRLQSHWAVLNIATNTPASMNAIMTGKNLNEI